MSDHRPQAQRVQQRAGSALQQLGHISKGVDAALLAHLWRQAVHMGDGQTRTQSRRMHSLCSTQLCPARWSAPGRCHRHNWLWWKTGASPAAAPREAPSASLGGAAARAGCAQPAPLPALWPPESTYIRWRRGSCGESSRPVPFSTQAVRLWREGKDCHPHHTTCTRGQGAACSLTRRAVCMSPRTKEPQSCEWARGVAKL